MINIRNAEPKDTVAIATIQKESWKVTYPNPEIGITEEMIEKRYDNPKKSFESRVERWLNSIINRDEYHLYLVAEDENNKVIGFCVSSKQNNLGEVNAIYIDPKITKRGIGGSLMKVALEFIKDCNKKIVHVTAYNQNAISFYEHYGFRKNKKEVEPLMIENIPMPIIEMEI
jgi:ribosomal protein S18 acetylase RimI-like enzyme